MIETRQPTADGPRPAAATGKPDAVPADTRGTLRRIATLLAPYRQDLVLAALAVIVAAALISLAPFLIKAVFDDALFPPSGQRDLGLLTWLSLGLIAIPLAAAAIGVGQNYLISNVGNSAVADLRGRLFARMQKMDLAFFTATKSGAIQSRLAADVNGVRTALTTTAMTLLSNAVTVVAALVAMVILSWQLTVVTLILMPIFVSVQVYLGRRQRLAQRDRESLAKTAAVPDESLSVSGILLAKVFNRADMETARHRAESARETRLQMRASMTSQRLVALVSTLFAITPAIIYLVAGRLIGSDAALSAGTLVAFITLLARLQMPLMQVTHVSSDVATSLALFRRVFDYLELRSAIRESPIAVPLSPADVRGDVTFRDVWFAHPAPRRLAELPGSAWLGAVPGHDGRSLGPSTPLEESVVAAAAASDEQQAERVVRPPDLLPGLAPDPPAAADNGFSWALSGVSLHVGPGQFAAIVGPSGSGKTTASYLIPRFYDVDRGTVRIDGIDVRDVTLDSLAGVVGIVTEEPYLFHGTIRDNLAYARPGATQDEIEQAARDANIQDRILSLTQGYDTIIGEHGCHLTASEKQRLAIARVLLMDPRVLILDEATSALDTQTERRVQEALDRATHNRTTIAIAHRLSTLMKADVIFVLDNGKLVERGTHEQLVALGGRYRRLYTEQFGAGQVEARLADGVKFIDGTVLKADRGVRSDVRC